jgi:hypothetical protein
VNYFFGIQSSYVDSKISIPRFQNSGKLNKDLSVFQLEIINQGWTIDKLIEIDYSRSFFDINSLHINNEKVFFLATDDDVLKLKKNQLKKLVNINNFTDTSPSFRANLEVSIKDGGFSSYQSEYPFSMVTKKGSILSPLSSLFHKDADKNIIFFKNIYDQPIKEKFSVFFVNINTKKILKKHSVFTNLLNEIVVDKDFIKPEVFLFSDKFLGVPIFCSISDKHISFEHTHPPHEYIMSEDKYKIVSNLKKKFYEIIN